MFDLISSEIEQYCEEHSTPETELLYRLNRETHLRILRPRMLSGHLQGAFLSFISRIVKPAAILEIGTYTGYSTLCLAEGLTSDGELHTIEVDEELEDIILEYVSQSDYASRITLHIGDALDVLPVLDKSWDLVFIDAEKKDYIEYYNQVLPKLRKGGIILVDNVLWSGKVVQEIVPNDRETRAILAFNDYVQQDESVKNMLLPFRDGIMMIEKL